MYNIYRLVILKCRNPLLAQLDGGISVT